MPRLASIGFCFLALLLSSCGQATHLDSTGTTLPAAQPAAVGKLLPLPGDIPTRAASAVINSVEGTDFIPQFSCAVALTAYPGLAIFSPDSVPINNFEGAAAYAMYELYPDVASVAPALHLSWVADKPEPGSAWVGVANFPGNRWEWYPWVHQSAVNLDLQGRHIDGQGRVLVTVFLTGYLQAQLQRVRIGANLAPVGMPLSVLHNSVPAPLQVSFDASQSFDPDGVIDSFEFDFDNDGTFDTTNQTGIGVIQAQQNGAFVCRVRITDDDGDSTDIYGGWETNFASSLAASLDMYSAEFLDCCSDGSSGGSYACGKCKIDGAATYDGLLARYAADGSLLWARRFSLSDAEIFKSVIPAPGGGVFTAGINTDELTEGETIVCRYDADGNLLWQRSWGGLLSLRNVRLAADYANSRLYCSTTLNVMNEMRNAVLLHFSFDGSLSWARTWGAADNEEGNGVALDSDGSPVLAVQTNNNNPNNDDIALIKFNPLGTQLSKLQLDSGNDDKPAALLSNGAGMLAVVGAMRNAGATQTGPFVIFCDDSLQPQQNYFLSHSFDADECFFDGEFQGSRFWASGMLCDEGGYNDAGLACFLIGPQIVSSCQIGGPPSNHNEAAGMALLPDGSIVLAGRCSADYVDWRQLPPDSVSVSWTISQPAPDAQTSMIAAQQTAGSSSPLLPVVNTSDRGAQLLRFFEPIPD